MQQRRSDNLENHVVLNTRDAPWNQLDEDEEEYSDPRDEYDPEWEELRGEV
jgi:hypothetical protein